MSFKAKKQYDLAVEQLKKASAEIIGMDTTKKDILYELGELSTLMGDKATALEYYKEIYAVDIGYRDITEKVESVYK